MSISKGKSEFNISSISDHIKDENLQKMLQKIQQPLENILNKSDKNKLDLENAKDFISTATHDFIRKIATSSSETSEETEQSSENQLQNLGAYESLENDSKELKTLLPSLENFSSLLPQVYASKDYNNIKIVHKDKILLDLDLEKLLKNEN